MSRNEDKGNIWTPRSSFWCSHLVVRTQEAACVGYSDVLGPQPCSIQSLTCRTDAGMLVVAGFQGSTAQEACLIHMTASPQPLTAKCETPQPLRAAIPTWKGLIWDGQKKYHTAYVFSKGCWASLTDSTANAAASHYQFNAAPWFCL